MAAATPAAGQCKVTWTLPTPTAANQGVRTGWEVSARAKTASTDGTRVSLLLHLKTNTHGIHFSTCSSGCEWLRCVLC